jgi:hypothetical protein
VPVSGQLVDEKRITWGADANKVAFTLGESPSEPKGSSVWYHMSNNRSLQKFASTICQSVLTQLPKPKRGQKNLNSMLYSKLFILAALSSASRSAAFDPAKDTPCNDQGICLSSFIWCDGSGQACAYPEGADALIPGATASYAVLYHYVKYDLRWRQARPGTNVLVEWLFDPRPFQENDDKSPGALPVMWSTST